ncbi:hypothetical protein H0H81_010862 [Sphagnurus paluster]|uniref:F-box domain-containing protein n=1 Tax=Sphagnurus paluster TaxID=117069 RepID=A0A9P7K2G8_9AGAR|nr:hypothetical protein H0H81_010862 [Sphagnurus paluster]
MHIVGLIRTPRQYETTGVGFPSRLTSPNIEFTQDLELRPETHSHMQSRVSQFAHILRTNDPPADLELAQIFSLLREVEIHISQPIHEEGDSWFHAAADDRLPTLRDALRGATSALRRMPAEIMTQIFYESLYFEVDDPLKTLWNVLDKNQTPWTLTGVSRRWREIAIAENRLWSSIIIDFPLQKFSSLPQPRLSSLIACLQRSGDHPLSISLTDRYNDGRQMFQHLLQHSKRWKCLKLEISASYFDILVSVKGKLPCLEFLYIKIETHAQMQMPLDCGAFEIAPRLQDVHLLHSFVGTVNIKLPWKQLQSLTVDSLTTLYASLKCTPQLSNLFCHFQLGRPTAITITELFNHRRQHSKIKTLVIDQATALDKLEFPSLIFLKVFSQVNEVDAIEHIIRFLSHSFCALETLVLSSTNIHSESEFDLLFNNTPFLRTLTMRYAEIDWDGFARVLTITPSRTPSVPRLESLTCFFVGHLPTSSKPDYALLLEMLQSRASPASDEKHGVSSLRSVALYPPPGVIIENRSSLVSSGMEVTVEKS